MMPVYRCMDSNPYQRNQGPFPHHYFPGFEAAPAHLKADPYKSPTPMMYEPWLCNSNHGYAVPYHGCCNHGNFPGYYSFRPPCPHFSPPPAFHHYPNYPTFAESSYPFYYVLPPHPSNEQPRHECDKDAHADYHCCGYPNHPNHQKNDRSLKIEEQEPDAEKKEVDSVVPIQPRSNSYPIVWIPPEYVKSKNRIDQPEMSNWEKPPSSTKPSKSLKPTEQEEPRDWNGWLPLDMNNLKSLMQCEGERKTQNQQNEDKMRQFPFPIFWVPSDWKQEEDQKQDKSKMKNASNQTKRDPISFEFGPVQPPDNGARMDKSQAKEDVSHSKNASEIRGNTAHEVSVPVKEMQADKDGSEATETRGGDVNVKRTEETTRDEHGGTTTKRKSPSPPKSSKLRPVCLRVDPLPNKRNGNGSSKSPSTPNGQNKDTLTKASTTPGLKGDSAVNTQNLNGSLEKVEPGKKGVKNIQVVDKRSEKNMAGESTSASQAQVLGDLPVNSQELLTEPNTGRAVDDSSEKEEGKIASSEKVGGAGTLKATNPDELVHDKCKAETKRMSDAEATKLIQSAYRGFQVRKWEPLKKLKQIAKVREQMHEVRDRIQALESSSDLNKDDRQRLLIGETIMSLLLKLDTIQGLHSTVRDARKSLARELVTLQEKLDLLTIKPAHEKGKKFATAEPANYPSVDGCINASIEEENGNASAVSTSSFSGTNDNGKSIKELGEEHLTHVVDEQANAKDEEPLIDQDLDGTAENKTTEVACDSECHAALRIQDGDVSVNLEHVSQQSSVPEEKPNADKSVEANDLSREGKPDVVEVDDLLPVSNNAEEDAMRSITKEMSDQVHAICETEKQIENIDGEVENSYCINKEEEIDLLEELPIGVIDEEPANSDEKCELHEIGESNTLSSTEGPFAHQSDKQLFEAASDNREKDQKENEFTKSPELEEKVEQMQEEVIDDNKFESILKPEEVHVTVGEENYDKVYEEQDDYGMIPVAHMASSESEAGSTATQQKEVLLVEKKAEEDQPVGAGEKEEIQLKNEVEVQESECMHFKEKTTDMRRGSAEERVLVGTDALSEPNPEPEFLPASPITGQKINDEHDLAEIGGDNRLIEENKKLREMMEKFMEAGKDQLAAMFDLTGRVKDLEEKLSRNKKLGRPRYRRIYAPSYSRPMKVRGKAAEVAM